jgi:hypothetical protein
MKLVRFSPVNIRREIEGVEEQESEGDEEENELSQVVGGLRRD